MPQTDTTTSPRILWRVSERPVGDFVVQRLIGGRLIRYGTYPDRATAVRWADIANRTTP